MTRLRQIFIYLSLILFSIFSLGVYVLGGLHYLNDREENSCEMTYMFEYPQYVRIKLDDAVEKKYPKYALFAYGEGFVTEKLRRMKFSGIPVLFIPGNAGSHEQVRSLASVSLRMGLKRRTPFHFDFFSVSLAEGYSALYGGILKDQTVFVSECLHRILNLYSEKMDKVILVGHSMGGIIAKAALLNNYNNSSTKNLSNILITLATPHTPFFAIDKTSSDFYYYINKNTVRLKEMGTSVISIGGGPRDLLVTSSQIIDPHADLNILSTAIPDAWISADHLSILWCKQLVIVFVRVLFDSVDLKKKKIYERSEARMNVFNYHLMNRYSEKLLERYESLMEFGEEDDWIEKNESSFTWKNSEYNNGEKKNIKFVNLMIPIDSEKFNFLSLDVINIESKDWLFICSTKSYGFSKTCKQGWNLTNRTRILTDYKLRMRKSLDLNIKEIAKINDYTHFIIRIPKTKMRVNVRVNCYSREMATSKVNGNSSLMSLFFFSSNIIIKSTKGRIRYFVKLEGISDAINIQLLSLSLDDINKGADDKQIIIELIETINSGSVSQIQTIKEEDIGKSITLRIQTKNPAELRFISDPSVKFEIKIRQAGLIDRLSCHIRDHWFRLYPVLVSFSLLLIGIRMDTTISSTVTIIITATASIILDLEIECLVAVGILCFLALITCFAVVFSGSIIHNFTAKFLTHAIRLFPASWYNWLLREGLYERLPLLSSLLVYSLISSSCGALAIVISVFIYFLKLIHMYDDYVEELIISSLRMVTTKFDGLLKKLRILKENYEDDENEDIKTNILNHLVIFLSWTLVAVLAIPSVLVWAKNFSYETRLSSEDTTMLASWIVLLSWGSLGLIRIPSTSNRYVKLIGVFQRLLGWSLFIIAGSNNLVIYQWLIPPTMALSITSIVFSSFLTKLFVKPIIEESQEKKKKKKTLTMRKMTK